MEWCRPYRVEGTQGLIDKQAGGNRAKLSQLQIEELQEMLHRTHAIILPGVTIGTDSIIAAGAIVTSSIPEYANVAGIQPVSKNTVSEPY